jgi:transketolase
MSPFVVPDNIKSECLARGFERGKDEREAWEDRLRTSQRAQEVLQCGHFAGEIPARVSRGSARSARNRSQPATKVATRKASEMALEVINEATNPTIGGSADLTGSNNTITGISASSRRSNRKGRYVHYGIREHGMAAAMNGMALHGGVHSLWRHLHVLCRLRAAAMRLSALMGLPCIYVMTHDSIGLGEDGPTHQPVEHLAMLRATPNMLVFRPADIMETAEAWEMALADDRRPTVLALSRQGLPTLRTEHKTKNLTAQRRLCAARGRGQAPRAH